MVFSGLFGLFDCIFGNFLKFGKLFLMRDTFSNEPLHLSLFSAYYVVKGFDLVIIGIAVKAAKH
jgi:hypothetical protein